MLTSGYIFTFESANFAMKAEIISDKISGVRMIPLLPEISASCGMSIKCNESSFKKLKKLFDDKKINYKSIYLVKNGKVLRKIL
ncbi:MAG: DUF3343 domain-containing protein [Peptoniphilaceae bacterium]